MAGVRSKVLSFDVAVDAQRTSRSGLGGTPIASESEWWAEHLVLAALVRCTLTSFDFQARRSGLDARASGSASGTVTKRESDDRYAFVEIEASYDVELDEPPDRSALLELVERAERGCFVGNSLASRPTYRWTVNGEQVA